MSNETIRRTAIVAIQHNGKTTRLIWPKPQTDWSKGPIGLPAGLPDYYGPLPEPLNQARLGGPCEFRYDPATYVDPREALMREVREETGQ